MADEIPLTGGNMTPVVRVGGSVRRTSGYWTPAVHALLAHLASAGFNGAPRPLGIDDLGREMLSYVEGTVPTYPAAAAFWSDATLARIASLLRRYHDATRGFAAGESHAWQLALEDLGTTADRVDRVICHNDFALHNLVFRRGRPEGIIDFDHAGPGSPLWDIAYAAYRSVPLMTDEHAASLGVPLPVDRERRLALFCTAYGRTDACALPEYVQRRIGLLRDTLLIPAARGSARHKKLVADGHARLYDADLRFARRCRPQWERTLT